MGLVACKKKAAFAQIDRDAKICEASGGLELRFDDMELQAEYERKLTPSARAAIRGTIDEEKAEEAASSLVQQTKEALQDDADDIDEDDDDDADDGSNTKIADASKDNSKTSLKPVLSSLGTAAKTRQTAAKTNQTEAKTNQTEDKPK